jgi:hypothetical protein
METAPPPFPSVRRREFITVTCATPPARQLDVDLLPFNAASPLYGLILPGLRVRVWMRVGDSGEWTAKWTGYLQSLDPEVGEKAAVSTAELTAYGVLSKFSSGDVNASLEENITTGAAMNALLDADGFPETDRSIETGQSTLSKWWVRKGSSRLEAVRELEDKELGRIREDEAGRLVFEDRSHALADPRASAVQATYGAGSLNIWNLRQTNPIQGIFNSIKAEVRTFNVSEETTLVVAGEKFGLYIDAEFIVDHLIHSVTAGRIHAMTVMCTQAPGACTTPTGGPSGPTATALRTASSATSIPASTLRRTAALLRAGA